MPDIVLSTLNAKYIHASFGLRYLFANLGSLNSRAVIKEFDINQRAVEIAEKILAENPAIVGFGVYIWNVTQTTEVVSILKRIKSEITLIVGGPEVSFEMESQEICRIADYVITGEADFKFGEVCESILSGSKPAEKIIVSPLPELGQLRLPYEFYTDEDIANRIIYVEASRGCPFTCEFCLSSLDVPVRQFPLESLLKEFDQLLARGVKHFKFVDRTFNLNLNTSKALLEYFLERYHAGLFLHFEMVPDRLPSELREIIKKFPSGALQFEVGIQSFNPEVGQLIKRRQNFERLEDNFKFLRTETGVHIHADLIVGLPGESLESFGQGFDRLIHLRPQEIQVGILKRLRGTPIVRHDSEWEMIYNSQPPYEILQNKLLSFSDLQKMRRFARFWDLYGNSGNFVESVELIWKGESSLFQAFMKFSEWLYMRLRRTDQISLLNLMESLWHYLAEEKKMDLKLVAEKLLQDYQRGERKDCPSFLSSSFPETSRKKLSKSRIPTRQMRHLASRS